MAAPLRLVAMDGIGEVMLLVFASASRPPTVVFNAAMGPHFWEWGLLFEVDHRHIGLSLLCPGLYCTKNNDASSYHQAAFILDEYNLTEELCTVDSVTSKLRYHAEFTVVQDVDSS